ncbi:MAG: cation transporter [Micavibrio sp.]|nr:cation transporter [Alphaproteobacteria bacterium]MAM34914.1 cation transporter [Micavibrio sp.]HAD71572.1 cation transporter [Gammaproteobacteria bacterium]|tara:strand:+ start:1913 stop:2539 length:627 start_codon:yes stop_codon:yes gene_type:complete
MADNCGDSCGNQNFDGMTQTYKRILWIIVAINGVMFCVEIIAGFLADSTALKADALDFLGDTATYGITLLVLGKSLELRAKAALLKGLSLGAMALFVLCFTLYRTIVIGEPEPMTMSGIGVLAFIANMISVFLLLKYREGDSNIKSVWLCSRNDAIGNIAVILAGLGVFASGTVWPDIVVAFIIAGLFMHSSVKIILQARKELKESRS